MEMSSVNFDDLFDFSPGTADNSREYDSQLGIRREVEVSTQGENRGTGSHLGLDNKAPGSHLGLDEGQRVETKRTTYYPKEIQDVLGHQHNLRHPEQGEVSQQQQSRNEDEDPFLKQLWEELPSSELDHSEEKEIKGRSGGEERRGRRGRGSDAKVKLERSRQSARECRARKKLRYQYLDDMILERERANVILRNELEKYVSWCKELDMGRIPDGWNKFLEVKEEVTD